MSKQHIPALLARPDVNPASSKRNIRMKNQLFSVAVCLFLSAASPAQTLRFSLKDLGTFGGTSAVALSVNSTGQVVGDYTINGKTNCFYWSAGTFGTLLWTSPYPTGSCVASAINDGGTIAGTSTLTSGLSSAFRAIPQSWRHQVVITYLTGPYGWGTYGLGINADADVIGTSNGVYGKVAAVFKGDGTYSELDGACAASNGTAIGGNVPFLACPFTYNGSPMQNGYGEVNGIYYNLQMLSGPPHQFAQANASDPATLREVGSSKDLNGFSHAVQWDFDPAGFFRVTDLMALQNSWATGLSHDNWIIGQFIGGTHPFVIYPNAHCPTPVDLNSLLDSSGTGWTLLTANAINNNHQIVGSGSINGVTHAVLLTSNGGLLCI